MSAGFDEAEFIWRDGEYVAWHDCKVHLLATAVQFGTSVFEGIRAYETPKGPAIFRLDAHIDRLIDSAKIYRMLPEYSAEKLVEVCQDVVRKNGLRNCYIRPMILRG